MCQWLGEDAFQQQGEGAGGGHGAVGGGLCRVVVRLKSGGGWAELWMSGMTLKGCRVKLGGEPPPAPKAAMGSTRWPGTKDGRGRI